jgi:hypothetical protein
MLSSLISSGGFLKFDLESEIFMFEWQCFNARKIADSRLHYFNTHIKKLVDLAVSFSFYFPHTTADMFLNITYLISHRKCVTTIQDSIAWLINTHYISGWQNGDCQTFAKGLFLLTNCSRGFRFCSSSGSSSIVIGCLTFLVALVLFKACRRSKQR